MEVLQKFLPPYDEGDLVLFRGECGFLYDECKIGFCWTTDEGIARRFASSVNAVESGGILLKAFAPASAIISAPNSHSINQMQEFEYTCNPKLLRNVELIEEFKRLH